MKGSLASHVTHLYNAQRELKYREPGVTGHALLEGNMYCEIMMDSRFSQIWIKLTLT